MSTNAEIENTPADKTADVETPVAGRALRDGVFEPHIDDVDTPPKLPNPPRKLDIGSGASRRDIDYTTIDLYAPEADIKASMFDMHMIASDSIEAIWCSHALEHLAFSEVPRALAEFARVLRPGARAMIQVPNFDYVAKYWFIGPDRPWAEKMVFGQQLHEGEFHKSAFTHGTLRADLEGAGFVDVRIEMRWTHSQETLQAVARKLRKGETYPPEHALAPKPTS